ncbi:adenylate/guanylate cyclase domain-containing protein [Kitasatospora sp. MBT63]|uniref:adenylate/guanylate cyclase domain-containing protein n=1 Tax=Kitasatospora sp. MBT63 TaxID=1444768 RepID=UPI0011EA6824|nr:adenylate/guanylate cyclase domain-containing protein [Kitasatospora sp. MBT63]
MSTPDPAPPPAGCPGCGTVNPPVARFCMACGTPTAQPAAAAPSGLRFVTVTFCDISGSTRLATSLSPELWHRVLGRYFATMRGAVEDHGGRVEKFIGDAVVGVFGADHPADDDAVRAVHATHEALRRLAGGQDGGVELSVRFGIASGQVVLADRDSSFAIGAVMNRAARLQAAAPPEGALADVRTWLLIRDQVRCTAVDPVAAKGFDTALQAWIPEPGARPAAARPPFVNQRPLLAGLTTAVAAALRRPGGSLLAVDGEPGSGKTSVLRQLAYGPAAAGALVVRLDCARDDHAQGRARLLELDAALAAATPGTATAAAGNGIAGSTAELGWRIGRRLARLSARQPLLLLIDNVQWASAELLQVIDGVPDAREAAGGHVVPDGCGPVVLVLAGRDLPAGLRRRPTVFGVPALSAEHGHRLLGLLRPATPAGGDLELHYTAASAALVARSGGNPLFLEQLAALSADGIEDLVAPSASAALGARIERLGHPARRVLGCIGAWGTAVGTRELSATAGLEPAELAEGIAELEQRQLAAGRPGEDGRLRFDCRSPAQVAYAHLALADRAELHTAVAGLLRGQAATAPGALEQAAVHAERALECERELRPGSPQQACAAELAAGCLVAAARRAVGRSDVRRAVELAARARESAADPALQLEAAAIESYALAACGRTADALELIDRTAQHTASAADPSAADPSAPDPSAAGPSAAGPSGGNPAAVFQLRANELALRPAGPDAVRAARRLAEQAGDHASRARLLLLEGLTAIGGGDYRLGERLLDAAYGGIRSAGAGLGTAEVHANLALCLAFGDSPVRDALARCEELRRATADAPALHALVGCSAALLHAFGGAAGPARDLLEQAREVFTGIGNRAALAGLYQFRSAVEEWAGDPAGAAHWQRAAADCCTEAGAGAAAARCLASAWLLDPRGPAPAGDPPPPGAGWEARVLHQQVEAVRLAARGDPAARGPIERSLAELDTVRGAGALLLPLTAALRIARAAPGCQDLAERAGQSLAAARAAKLTGPEPPGRP